MTVLQEPPIIKTEESQPPEKPRFRWRWEHTGLAAILALSAFLNFYRLDQNGFTNEYYAAAVRSMMTSWHNFFYGSYDPGGFITFDKPPAAYWVQTISALILGYNGVSILVPSALAGVAGVALLYYMVRRVFGPVAGLLSALALAVTPIFVVMDRHNNPESLLVFSLLVAAWALSRAAEKGRLPWLLLAVAMVGVGFNIKMLEAFVILPAFYLMYFLLAPISWPKRIIHLSAATVVLVVVSFSWATIVELTPASQRPYIGSSSTNSVFNLIIGYNGLGRIDGQENRGGNRAGGGQPGQPPAGNPFGGQNGQNRGGNAFGGNNNGQPQPPFGGRGQNGGFGNSNNQPPFTFPGNGNGGPAFGGFGGGGRPGGGVVAGQPGALRMFQPDLAGEAGWLLPLTLLTILVGAIQTWRRFAPGPDRRRRWQALMLWGGWLVMFMAVFSMAQGIFHSYYLVMLAPGVAALFGIGIEVLWHSYRRGGWQSFLLPIALVVTTAFELNILSRYSDWNRTLALVVAGIELLVVAALVALPRLLGTSRYNRAAQLGAVGLGALALLAAPAAWAINDIFAKTFTNATLPTAYPAGANERGFGFGRNASNPGDLVANLTAHWNGWFWGMLSGLVIVGLVGLGLRFYREFPQCRPISRGLALLSAALIISLGLAVTTAALPPAQASSNITNNQAPSTGVIGNPAFGLSNTDKLISFLEANRNGATYLVATTTSQNASPIIIKTGLPVMAMGGFMGSDNVLTLAQLQQLVANNTVRYFLLDNFRMGGSQQIGNWVQQNCQVVNSQLWSGNSTASSTNGNGFGRVGFGGGGSSQLYDCTALVKQP